MSSVLPFAVSNHVLEIMVSIKKTRTLSDEEALRVSVELHRIVEAVRHGCEVIRNPGSGPDHAVVDTFLKSLRREDIIADLAPFFIRRFEAVTGRTRGVLKCEMLF